jgi:leucyl aminopeptidase
MPMTSTLTLALLFFGSSGSWAAQPAIGPAPWLLRARPSPEHRLINRGEGHYEWMAEPEISELKQRIHETEHHCGGFMDVTEHPVTERIETEPFGFQDALEPSHPKTVETHLSELSSQNLIASIGKLSAYHDRYFSNASGVEAAQWIRGSFEALSGNRTDVKIELFSHKFKQPSVVVTLAGSGPRADETIVLGAHEDSIHMGSVFPQPGGLAPGADDDASGIATLLETFRVLMASSYRPDRTLVFIAYAGEERGLLGSQDIAASFQKNGRRVMGVMQLDMTMYPGQSRKMTFMTDNVSSALTKFSEMLVDRYVKMPWKEDRCGYACSDHASWDKLGYPAVMPFEAGMKDYNPRIHGSQDTWNETLEVEFGMHFAQLATAFVIELSAPSSAP